ncbi:penicillin acylase family protein [Pseudobacteriovorax antillogorgiicola]|uniref:Penicillin amidase n=1 Tax=Pseudobacteriovorax antillogorgiicola TaxID=1513793 RepID=A0A1Y6BKN2_9BACT|nr:penicillin acylase family protein [Pseudobacteriovorax antillogorgiicola]TCS56235.1 penicillin amidase [Pseudobacteriovorax antillogorgiicola]SMF08209.1 penicillin amidase [Pseudobacteriovorax antillogorgiicola]
MVQKFPSTFKFFYISFLNLYLVSCSILTSNPEPLTTSQRMMAVKGGVAPVDASIKIYWDQHAIPFIEAKSESDGAFALGVVHGHLRLGQIMLLKHISQGRISELSGPIPQVATIDHGIRILGLKASAERSLEIMEPQTKRWLERFTDGINWYKAQLDDLPVEFSLFDLENDPLTTLDMMTIARLASADLTWGVYLRFLKLAEKQGWEKAYQVFLNKKQFDIASFQNKTATELSELIMKLSRSGSNSIVVHKDHAASTGALIANDPHVGLFLPNFWLIAGIKTPQFHSVGLMIPGLPFFGLGRNQNISWGGTNMRGISSHLYDVSQMPAEQIKVRKETLKRRWWWSREVEIRETPVGPILSDLDYFDQDKIPVVAINWLGRQGSDELTAFLKANKAKNWEEFSKAFHDYRVSAQNMVYADKNGNIGMVLAYGQPVLKDPSETLKLIKEPNNKIQGVLTPRDLPKAYNPKSGLLASANNQPFTSPPIPIAHGYAPNDRHERMIELLKDKSKVTLEDLKELQGDVYSQSAFQLKQTWARRLDEIPQLKDYSLIKALISWDGKYNASSAGAVAFEILSYQAWQSYVEDFASRPTLQAYLTGYGGWKPILSKWLDELDGDRFKSLAEIWLPSSQEHWHEGQTWGDIHIQTMQSPLGMLPLVGERFRFRQYGADGGNDTLFKTGRVFSPKQESVTYGASSRHISDMGDPDANYFILKGGQDGWLSTPNLTDQLDLWRNGEYIQVPLSMSKVRSTFNTHVTVIKPMSH